MKGHSWIGKALLALAVLVPVAGLAASIFLSVSGNSGAISLGGNEVAAQGITLTAESFPAVPATGNLEGNRIPEFAMTLADGSAVTSATLVEEGRPTFLFFWATT